MASRQTQFTLEKMIPEFTAYKRSKVFQGTELTKLISRRKVFEEQINADLPPLRLFIQYISHLHSTHQLVIDRWLKMGNSREELFEEAGNVYMRINGVVDLALRRYRGNPEAWQAILELLGRINLYDKRASVAQLYLQLFPSEAEPWILAAQIAEESEGIAHARSLYQQAAKAISLCPGVAPSTRYHGFGRTGLANTEHNKRVVEVAIRRKLDAVRASTDPQLLMPPWKRYSALIINWALFEVRHVSALRGKYGEQNYLSDYVIDKQLDGSSYMRSVLQGDLVALVLQRGILAALSVLRLANLPDDVEFSLLLEYEQGKIPYFEHSTEVRAACYADMDRLLSSSIVDAFIREAYTAIDALCSRLKWVSWWTSRVMNRAIEKALAMLRKALETDELRVLKRYQTTTVAPSVEALKELLSPSDAGDYSLDPLKNAKDTISIKDLQRLEKQVSMMVSEIAEAQKETLEV